MSSLDVLTISAPTRMGRFQLLASERGLRVVYWPGEDKKGGRRRADGENKDLQITAKEFAHYFEGKRVKFSAKLDLSGLSPFAQTVLRALAKVPYGKTITYGELARRAGSPKAARAVGSILASNPLPIVIPCHRVIAGEGSLGGFRAPGGLKLKRKLLRMERAR